MITKTASDIHFWIDRTRLCALIRQSCPFVVLPRTTEERGICPIKAPDCLINALSQNNLEFQAVAAVAATLPPEVVTAAQARGRARDLDATVAELLEELAA